MAELTYEKDGRNIKTSQFLRNRGSCCKTSCLHCPYGFTIEKEKLQFDTITDENFNEAKSLIPDLEVDKNDVAAMLLATAFGGNKSKKTLTKENKKSYLLVKLKGQTCALIKKNNLQVTEIYYTKYFNDQGITKELINGLIF